MMPKQEDKGTLDSAAFVLSRVMNSFWPKRAINVGSWLSQMKQSNHEIHLLRILDQVISFYEETYHNPLNRVPTFSLVIQYPS